MISLDELTKNMSLFIPKGCGCSGSGETPDMSDYYTKEEVDALIDAIEVTGATEDYVDNAITAATEGLASEEYVDNAITAATEGLASEAYVDAAVTAATEGLASEEYVDAAITGATQDMATKEWTKGHVSLSISAATQDMATKTWVNEQGYLTEHQSLDGYATEAYVDSGITEAADEIKAWSDSQGYLKNITITINNQPLHNGDSINIEGGGTGSTVVVDSEMSNESINPVQNKVITAALDSLSMDIPTAVSDLDNDAGYITSADTQNFATKTYVDDAIAQAGGGIKVWLGTKEEYLNLETYDNNTLYLTKE